MTSTPVPPNALPTILQRLAVLYPGIVGLRTQQVIQLREWFIATIHRDPLAIYKGMKRAIPLTQQEWDTCLAVIERERREIDAQLDPPERRLDP